MLSKFKWCKFCECNLDDTFFDSLKNEFCSITKQIDIKSNNRPILSLDEFKKIVGNKTVYNENDLENIYNKSNVVVLEMLYNGYFGKGKNITHRTLCENGLFEGYPYTNKLTKDEFIRVLEMGGKNVQDIIIN